MTSMSLDKGRRPPRPPRGGGNPYRHPGGRTYRMAYGTALAAITVLVLAHRSEVGDVWSAVVRWARTGR